MRPFRFGVLGEGNGIPQATRSAFLDAGATVRAAWHLGSELPDVDAVIAEPVLNPETAYWLWKNGGKVEGLNLPPVSELFTRILQTLSALGRTG